MTENHRIIHAPVQAVWDVLSDGWLYPVWVVGASRMRDVDDDWPSVGSRLHHSAGVWPVMINDETKVLANQPLQRLQLRAKGWPLGEADVVITLEQVPEDVPASPTAQTRVRIDEDAATGPGRLVPKPVRAPMILWRNTETLRRLALLVEGRAQQAKAG